MSKKIHIDEAEGVTWLSYEGWSFPVPSKGPHRVKKKKAASFSNGEIRSPMPGQLLKVLVKAGQDVTEGDTLCIVEAMKMEHSLKAPFSGAVSEVFFTEGESLQGKDLIIKLNS